MTHPGSRSTSGNPALGEFFRRGPVVDPLLPAENQTTVYSDPVDLDDLVERVIDRIEQRVVDELERRGRRQYPGAL